MLIQCVMFSMLNKLKYALKIGAMDSLNDVLNKT